MMRDESYKKEKIQELANENPDIFAGCSQLIALTSQHRP
jgi:hypothetical protein